MTNDNNVQFVVLHRPGPAWKSGVDFREQPGVMDHVQHYAKLLDDGKLALGGPYLVPDRGGMMVTMPGVGENEINAFAATDPAVASGLLEYEVIPWFTPMKAGE